MDDLVKIGEVTVGKRGDGGLGIQLVKIYTAEDGIEAGDKLGVFRKAGQRGVFLDKIPAEANGDKAAS